MDLLKFVQVGDVLHVSNGYDPLEMRQLIEIIEVVAWGRDYQTLYCRSRGKGTLCRYDAGDLGGRLILVKRHGQIVYESERDGR
jgi:hypothetical protein